jgi:hypothetical protein
MHVYSKPINNVKTGETHTKQVTYPIHNLRQKRKKLGKQIPKPLAQIIIRNIDLYVSPRTWTKN